jgi:hypothetical protein
MLKPTWIGEFLRFFLIGESNLVIYIQHLIYVYTRPITKCCGYRAAYHNSLRVCLFLYLKKN